MICKKIGQRLVRNCHFYHNRENRSQQTRATQLFHTSQYTFVNIGMNYQMDDEFSDQEMEMETEFKNLIEEVNQELIGKYIDSIKGNNTVYSSKTSWIISEDMSKQGSIKLMQPRKQNNNKNVKNDKNEKNKNDKNINIEKIISASTNLLAERDGVESQTSSESNSQHRMYLSFTMTMQRVDSVFSAEDKLNIILQYCLQIKHQGKEIEQKQKDLLIQTLKPIIKTLNEDTAKYSPATLYTLFNLAREDFLDIGLTSKILAQIKQHLQNNYYSFELQQIRQLWYANCMKNKNTQFIIIEPNMLRSWFGKINSKILRGECNESELILFMSYHHKEIDLFRKTYKFIQHTLLCTPDGVLQRSKNAELLKVFISIFSKCEKGSQVLYELFIQSLYSLIQQNLLSNAKLHIIIRNLLHSQLFLSYGIISSYPRPNPLPQLHSLYSPQLTSQDSLQQTLIHSLQQPHQDSLQQPQQEYLQQSLKDTVSQQQFESNESSSMNSEQQISFDSSIQRGQNDIMNSQSSSQEQQIKEVEQNVRQEQKDDENNVKEQNDIVQNKRKILEFDILDNFVKENMKQLSCNQILNLLNLYNLINAQNCKSTVIELLNQLSRQCLGKCDNYLSFNITVRVLSQFSIEKAEAEQYLSMFACTAQKIECPSTEQLQIFALLQEMLPTSSNPNLQQIYATLEKEIQEDAQTIQSHILKQISFSMTPTKKIHFSLIQFILFRLNASYTTFGVAHTNYVDFYLKSPTQQDYSQQNSYKLPLIPFAIDIISPNEVMAPGIYNGNLSIKIKLLKSFKIPHVNLSEEFCYSLQKLDSDAQDEAFIQEINSQVSSQL